MTKKKNNRIKIDQDVFYSNVERRLALKNALVSIMNLHISCEHDFCDTCSEESPCGTIQEVEKVFWAISL